MTIKEHDFIEVSYTGKLTDGAVFDTNQEEIAKQNNLHNPQAKYAPATICVGEKQLLPGLDQEFIGKEIGKEYTVTLQPEQAFGKRDINKMKIVPMDIFKEHKVQPQPGLQINVDGEIGTVSRVSGGRVIVNFNHPLAGKEVVYTFKIEKQVIDRKEQIASFLNTSFKFPKEQLEIDLTETTAIVTLPVALPPEFADAVGKKLKELTLLEVTFTAKAPVEPKK